MTITFDKNTATECSVEMDYFNEQIIDGRVNFGWDRDVTSTFEPQDLSGFVGKRTFSTIELLDSQGSEVELSGTYNRIMSLVYGYYDIGQHYSINLVLGYEEE